jgi:hypothetical protein
MAASANNGRPCTHLHHWNCIGSGRLRLLLDRLCQPHKRLAQVLRHVGPENQFPYPGSAGLLFTIPDEVRTAGLSLSGLQVQLRGRTASKAYCGEVVATALRQLGS